MLPRSLIKRLVNHARPGDVTEGYAADWTVEQLREPAQRIADRIDELTGLTCRRRRLIRLQGELWRRVRKRVLRLVGSDCFAGRPEDELTS